MVSSCVELQPGSIWINGLPQLLLTSSLFYFRIPAKEWRNRLQTIRLLGYNSIDVYIPWNYHELEPGRWNFGEERDVRVFLELAKEERLWVIARPGPYICSEWDGGGLPAYLFTDPGLRIRDDSPKYMQAVRTWYDQIMPLLAEYQVGNTGTIVLIQIENELDFFDCYDRITMMTALRDMARSHGITVPLIACAGQGDLRGATGEVAGIVPAFNFYVDSRDRQIEPRFRHYDSLMRKQGYPLCVTETNRSHTDLRRLIAGGAKLLGPYLQAGGTDIGFTNSVNNWGEPLAFVTSQYDFGGMISPGGKVRPEGIEAIILSKMLSALGTALSLSIPSSSPPLLIHGLEGHALALYGGGWLIGLPNPSDEATPVKLGSDPGLFPKRVELEVAPNTCPFMLFDFPLSRWGMAGKITYATAELVEYKQEENRLILTFAANTSAELMVDWPESIPENCQGWQIESSLPGWRLWIDRDFPTQVEFSRPDGKSLVIKAADRNWIGNLKEAGLNERQVISLPTEITELDLSSVDWQIAPIDPCAPEWFAPARPCKVDTLHLEENGILRGFGWYQGDYHGSKELQGLLIHSGGDVLSLYLNGQFLGTLVPGGGDAYLPLSKKSRSSLPDKLVVRSEIWGHSNFDDHRLPALRLKSMRGMTGLSAISKKQNITSNWFYQHKANSPAEFIDPLWPLIHFGGWSTTDEPSLGTYHKEVLFTQNLDTRVLHFPGLQVNAQVFINRQLVGAINPFNPFLNISDYSHPGMISQIAMIVEQDFRQTAGQVFLFEGEKLKDWRLAGWDETGLADHAEKFNQAGEKAGFPVTLAGGKMAWLSTELPLSVDWERGWVLQVVGQGMKVSAWIGRHLVGRIWLPSYMRPRMAGGADDRVIIPADWLREASGRLHLLLESVSNHPLGEIISLKFLLET